MKKIFIISSTLILIGGAIVFFLINNQGYCTDQTCIQYNQTGIIDLYNDKNLSAALQRGDSIALYFEASRCTNCKLLKEELISRGIPPQYTLFIVDFDKALDLRKRYHIQNQHTLITLDQKLNIINKDESGEYEKVLKLLK